MAGLKCLSHLDHLDNHAEGEGEGEDDEEEGEEGDEVSTDPRTFSTFCTAKKESTYLNIRLQQFLNLKSATVSGGTFYSPDIKNIV